MLLESRELNELVTIAFSVYQNYMQIYETGNCESTIAREPLKRRVRRILVVELGLVVFQQLNGASSLLFHMETIFDGLEVMDRGKVQIIVIVIVAIQVRDLRNTGIGFNETSIIIRFDTGRAAHDLGGTGRVFGS